MPEKMRVLDMLENGKITADEAARLLESLGRARIFDKEQRENMEEKFKCFAQDVNRFARDVGEKVQIMYKNVEPKIKKAGQTALEKAAAALDELAHTIHDSLEKANKEACCEDGTDCCGDDAPREN
jgi:polyhydroxyalkanoate synthesis regulator phasin